MGLGYNVAGSPAGTMNQLTSNGVPDSFGLFMCPAFQGASGTGPDGAQSGTALGEIEWDTVDNLMNNPLAKAAKDSFGWIKVFPQNVYTESNEGNVGPWYAVSLVKVSVTDSLDTSKLYGSANIQNLQLLESSGFSNYNSIFDCGNGAATVLY